MGKRIEELKAQLRMYEDNYGFASSELRGKIYTGMLKETWSLCKWGILIDTLELCKGKN